MNFVTQPASKTHVINQLAEIIVRLLYPIVFHKKKGVPDLSLFDSLKFDSCYKMRPIHFTQSLVIRLVSFNPPKKYSDVLT